MDFLQSQRIFLLECQKANISKQNRTNVKIRKIKKEVPNIWRWRCASLKDKSVSDSKVCNVTSQAT